MLFQQVALLLLSTAAHVICDIALQRPLQESIASESRINASFELFKDLEEYSRIVDIAYCVGTAGLGIQKPFLCASRCEDFKSFELITVKEASSDIL